MANLTDILSPTGFLIPEANGDVAATGTISGNAIQTYGQLLVGKEEANNNDIGHIFYPTGTQVSTVTGNEAIRCVRNDNGNLIRFNFGTAYAGSIRGTNGTVSYETASDHRLKENLTPIEEASSRVLALNPLRFSFKHDDSGRIVDGFLAHEAQAVVPEAVSGSYDGFDIDGEPVYQGIDQAKLVPLLTAALQEALIKIEEIESQNALIIQRLIALEGE